MTEAKVEKKKKNWIQGFAVSRKKASHEANKLKCEGLTTEHNDLVTGIAKTKALLLECPFSTRNHRRVGYSRQ